MRTIGLMTDDEISTEDIDQVIRLVRIIKEAQGGEFSEDAEDILRQAILTLGFGDGDEYHRLLEDFQEQCRGVNEWLACRRVVKHTVGLMREQYVRWQRMRGGAYKWRMVRDDGDLGVGLDRVRFNPPLHRQQQQQQNIREGRLSFAEFVESRQPLKSFLKHYQRRDGDLTH